MRGATRTGERVAHDGAHVSLKLPSRDDRLLLV